jgi:hypothetical protein
MNESMYLIFCETILLDLVQSTTIAATCINYNIFELPNNLEKDFAEALLEENIPETDFPMD